MYYLSSVLSLRELLLKTFGLFLCRALAVQVDPNSKRSVLVDLLTVYGQDGKAIVFTQTKREADEVAAAIAGHMPCEVTKQASVWVFCLDLWDGFVEMADAFCLDPQDCCLGLLMPIIQ